MKLASAEGTYWFSLCTISPFFILQILLVAFSSFSLALKALSLSCSLGMRLGVMKTDWIQLGLDTPRSLILLYKISFFNFKEATITFNKRVLEGFFYQVVLDFQ